jgi:hypothetical protein
MKLTKFLSVFLLLPILAHAQVKVNALPAASSANTTDLTICDQTGTTRSCTLAQLAALINSNQYGSGVVTATLASTCNNCAPSGTGTFSSTTTLLRLTPASGGSTVSGFLSSGFINGQVVIVRNMSSTDNLIFPHLSSSSSSGNEISNQNAGTVLLPPLAAAPMIWDNNTWVFF